MLAIPAARHAATNSKQHRIKMKSKQITFLAAATAIAATTAHAATISVPDLTQTPTADATQTTDIAALNGGVVVNPQTTDPVSLSYYVTTFSFGTGSTAHLQTFFEFSGGQDRLGVEVQDSGLVQIAKSGDPGRTNTTISGGGAAGFMAGQAVTLLVRSYWDSTNDGLRATLGTGDDMLMNIWVNPTSSSTETAVTPGDANMLNDGDLHTLWNSDRYTFLRQQIFNNGTAGGAGDNSIINTTVFTGSDATFANALAAATIPEPSTAFLGALGALALLRRRRN